MIHLLPWTSGTKTLRFLLTIFAMVKTSFESSTMTYASGENKVVHDLYLMGLFPFTGAWNGGESLLAAATLGVNHINSLPHVLPGYRLHIVYNDTKCDPGLGIKILFEQLFTLPTKIMVLGDGCSIVSEATARASHLWNLVQVSYASVSPGLSDKSMFPRFARLSAPDLVTNQPRLEFFRLFGWTRIATIHQTYELFSSVTENLVDMLRKSNFTVLRSEIFRDDPSAQVRSLKETDCRIIVGAFYADKARKVFCEAYKVGLYGRRVVWILPGWFDDQWWLVKDQNIDCTPQELAEAVEGYFDAGIVYVNPNPEPTVSGWLPSDFLKAYNDSVKGAVLPGDIMAPQGYDAVWAMALALNQTRQRLQELGSKKGLEDFTYENSEMARLLYRSLLNVSFMGVRGPMSFDKNGDPVGLVKLDQIQGGVKQVVGLFNPSKQGDNKFEWSNSYPIIWQGGSPPRDSIVTKTLFVTVATPLYIAMCFLAALGIVLATSFFVFNIILRDVRIVKMSSPRLNNVILLGCISTFSSIFVEDKGGVHGVIGCEVKTALLSVGVSLAFGALFAKTWRVHVIFTNSKLQKRTPKMRDEYLLAMVGVLLLLDVVVLVTWWMLDPRTLQTVEVTTNVEEDAIGEVVVSRCELGCRSKYQKYFLGTLYGIHALLLVFGTFLAWETRKVHYEDLNDSKYIGMCIYNVVLLSIPAVVLSVAPASSVDLEYALDSILLLLGTTVTQCLIFVPKVLAYHSRQHETATLHTVASVHDGPSGFMASSRQINSITTGTLAPTSS